MAKFISILRGINVGGHRKILMIDLKELYGKLGYENCISYIQSGNVIFESNVNNTELIQKTISKAIYSKYGYDVPVMVRKLEYFENVVKNNPFFKTKDTKSIYLTFLSKLPFINDIEKLKEIDCGKDEYKVIDRAVHITVKLSYHKSKLSNQLIEKKLNCSATTRNWKTINKLIELAK